MRPWGRGGRHAHAVLTFQLAGAMGVEHRGSFELHAGDVHLIPPGDAHRITRSSDAEVWCAALSPASLDAERFGALLAPLDLVARGALPRISIPAARRDFMASLFRELGALEGRAEPVRSEGLLAVLLGEIGDHARAVRELPARRSDVAAEAIAFIAARALGPLSLSEVARGIGRNRSHVAAAVHKDTGRSVGAWIAEVRLEEARRRLEETDELIEVIGERVGYVDATHFARMFRRRFGSAPRAWRTLHR
jgi:AraC-like DNA-binding protein